MVEFSLKINVEDDEQAERILSLIARNEKIAGIVQVKVLGHACPLFQGDIVEDALHSHLATQHQLIRILNGRAG